MSKRGKPDEKQGIVLTKKKGRIQLKVNFSFTPRQFWLLLLVVTVITAIGISSMSAETRNTILGLLAELFHFASQRSQGK